MSRHDFNIATNPAANQARNDVPSIIVAKSKLFKASMGMSTHRFALCVHYPTCQGGFAPWTPGLTASRF